jgi:hypothetical protein
MAALPHVCQAGYSKPGRKCKVEHRSERAELRISPDSSPATTHLAFPIIIFAEINAVVESVPTATLGVQIEAKNEIQAGPRAGASSISDEVVVDDFTTAPSNISAVLPKGECPANVETLDYGIDSDLGSSHESATVSDTEHLGDDATSQNIIDVHSPSADALHVSEYFRDASNYTSQLINNTFDTAERLTQDHFSQGVDSTYGTQPASDAYDPTRITYFSPDPVELTSSLVRTHVRLNSRRNYGSTQSVRQGATCR